MSRQWQYAPPPESGSILHSLCRVGVIWVKSVRESGPESGHQNVDSADGIRVSGAPAGARAGCAERVSAIHIWIFRGQMARGCGPGLQVRPLVSGFFGARGRPLRNSSPRRHGLDGGTARAVLRAIEVFQGPASGFFRGQSGLAPRVKKNPSAARASAGGTRQFPRRNLDPLRPTPVDSGVEIALILRAIPGAVRGRWERNQVGSRVGVACGAEAGLPSERSGRCHLQNADTASASADCTRTIFDFGPRECGYCRR
jgi:hypothetical protein